MYQRVLRGRLLLRGKRVCYMCCLNRKVWLLQGYSFPRRRIQVLAEESCRCLLLGWRRVYQYFLRGRPLLCVNRFRLRLPGVRRIDREM